MVSNDIGRKRHRSKFKRWQSSCPAATRFLSEEVERRFVPLCEQRGYKWVDVWLDKEDMPVSRDEIILQKCIEHYIEYIYIAFDKYLAPRFQVLCARRSDSPGNEFIWSGNLVAKKNEYYHFWGKPWWVPLSMWSDANSSNIISKVVEISPQIFTFLESGERGDNIGKSVHVNR